MIRLSTLFWLILMSATGFAMFAVKYQVQALADQLAQTTRQTGQAEHELRVLDAEWAYLNRPDALAQMNQRYLSLAPIATKQLRTSVADIPMRPAPPAPSAPVETVAAVAEMAVPAAMRESASGANQPPTNPATQPSSPEPSAAPVVTAALERPAAAAEPARAAPTIRTVRPSPGRRAKSLDALIALIAENR